MEIVIELSDILMEYIVKGRDLSEEQNNEMALAIADGTPLPKEHGRLIDYDDLLEQLDRCGRKNVKYQLPYSPTIIFADKEVNADE